MMFPDGQNCGSSIFWGEIAPSEHLVQIYEDERAFMNSLEGFVGGGLNNGESVVVVATPAHIKALEERLLGRGHSLSVLRSDDRYITIDAEYLLTRFMINDWPDEELFSNTIKDLLVRARGNGRAVRAFGEMVAILWAKGHTGATVRLEHLWHSLCHEEGFTLYCAYPKSGFTQDAQKSMDEICATHSKVVTAPTFAA